MCFTRKCKEDFAHSLNGIQSVTKEFLTKINNLFPHQLTFHLTCESQQEEMGKIRNSCTNLSKDVENKFQLYLDNVGNKVMYRDKIHTGYTGASHFMFDSSQNDLQCRKRLRN